MNSKVSPSRSRLPGVRRGIVPALDIEDFAATLALVQATTGIEGIAGYKLGLSSVLRHGLFNTVRALRDVTPLPLYYDHQKAGLDIPAMGAKFAALAAEAGVDGVILFPLGGPTTLTHFVEGSLARGVRPIVGGELPLHDYSLKGGGYVANGALKRIAEVAASAGASDFVIPGQAVSRVKRVASHIRSLVPEPSFFLPGIAEHESAIRETLHAVNGARAYAIIGRAIYNAADPAAAARRLAGEALASA